MGVISSKFSLVDGYLSAIYRNPKNGWYEVEIALPNNWVIRETKEINCEILNSNEMGKFVLISPKENSNIDVDDLINFIIYVVETNKKVEEKEKEFKSILEAEKIALEAKVNVYLSDLESLKKDSFNTYTKVENTDNDSLSNENKNIKKIHLSKERKNFSNNEEKTE